MAQTPAQGPRIQKHPLSHSESTPPHTDPTAHTVSPCRAGHGPSLLLPELPSSPLDWELPPLQPHISDPFYLTLPLTSTGFYVHMDLPESSRAGGQWAPFCEELDRTVTSVLVPPSLSQDPCTSPIRSNPFSPVHKGFRVEPFVSSQTHQDHQALTLCPLLLPGHVTCRGRKDSTCHSRGLCLPAAGRVLPRAMWALLPLQGLNSASDTTSHRFAP